MNDISNAFGFTPEGLPLFRPPREHHVADQPEPPPGRIPCGPGVPAETPRPPAVEIVEDPTEAGNRAREQAGRSLSQLTWTFPDGTRKHAKLTSSRFALFSAVCQVMVPTPDTDDPVRALALASSQRYLTAGLMLWFCLHEPEAWETPRRIVNFVKDRAGEDAAEITYDVPLENDWRALIREARRWADEAIPPNRLDDAVFLTETITRLTLSALPVRRASDDEVPDENQKKTHPQDGKTDTFPSSVPSWE